MICLECQRFNGSHSHNVPYHQITCTCDGNDKSRRLIMDPDAQVEIRMSDVSDVLKEIDSETGVYSGSEKPTFPPDKIESVRRLMRD